MIRLFSLVACLAFCHECKALPPVIVVQGGCYRSPVVNPPYRPTPYDSFVRGYRSPGFGPVVLPGNNAGYAGFGGGPQMIVNPFVHADPVKTTRR